MTSADHAAEVIANLLARDRSRYTSADQIDLEKARRILEAFAVAGLVVVDWTTLTGLSDAILPDGHVRHNGQTWQIERATVSEAWHAANEGRACDPYGAAPVTSLYRLVPVDPERS